MGRTVVIDMRSKTVKKKKTSSRSQMAGKKGSKKSKSKSKSRSSTNSGDGKIFGFKIPVLTPLLKDPTVRKLVMGAGLVSVILTTAQIVNNQKINAGLNRRGVKPVIALAGGDVVGAAFQVAKDENLFGRITNRGGVTPIQMAVVNEAGFA